MANARPWFRSAGRPLWPERRPITGRVAGVSHENNLLRVEDNQWRQGVSRRDTVYTTSVGRLLDQPLGRQRLSADGASRTTSSMRNRQ